MFSSPPQLPPGRLRTQALTLLSLGGFSYVLLRQPRRRLLELEIGPVSDPVGRLQDEGATGAGPALVGLPDVGVTAAGGVVAEGAASGVERRVDPVRGR